MNKKKIIDEIVDLLKTALIALIVVLIIMQFVLVAQIDGSSMYPTLVDGEHVITARRFVDYEAGDIVAFNFVEEDGTESFHVKRIVGMPGDTVTVDGTQVFVNDQLAVADGIVDYGQATYELSASQYFMMGDNYQDSYDSRLHGPVEEKQIFGEIIVELPF